MSVVSEYGRKIVAQRTVLIPPSMLTESVPGAVYQLEIKTKGIPDPQKVISVLTTELPRKFPDLKVLWIRVENQSISMQITSNPPFTWALLLALLPEILMAIGITILFITVYLVVSWVPSWIWALLLTGTLLFFVAPGIARTIAERIVPPPKPPEKKPPPPAPAYVT